MSKKLKKCCFIVVYFGKLPNSFSIFLKSCAVNKSFQWIIFTDDETKFDYPENVSRKFFCLEEFKNLASNKLGFMPTIPSAYKLCDFKPAYGYLFEEYIRDYAYWGHIDIDTIVGRLDHFLSWDLLEQYDKLFCLGHCVIYKNTPEVLRLFMEPLNGRLIYQDAFTNPDIVWFDEEWNGHNNVNQIFLSHNKRVYQVDLSANIDVWKQRFRLSNYQFDTASSTVKFHIDECRHTRFFWSDNGIFSLRLFNGRLVAREYLYLHYQWRKMRNSNFACRAKTIQIVPNAFLPVKRIPNNFIQWILSWKYYPCFYGISRPLSMFIKRRVSKLKRVIQERDMQERGRL